MSATARLPALDPAATPKPMHAETRIGHVHLKVADLDRALTLRWT